MDSGAKRIGMSGGMVLVLAAAAADAATKSVTVAGSGPGVVTMALFDPALGKLLSVYADATYSSVVPYMSMTTPVGYDHAVTGSASLGSLSFTLSGASSVMQQSGYGYFSVTASGSTSWTDPADLSGLLGTSGNVVGYAGVSAPAPGRLIAGSFLPSATYHVTYTYDDSPAVPEPATWAMMVGGFVLTGLALRAARRNRAVAKPGEA